MGYLERSKHAKGISSQTRNRINFFSLLLDVCTYVWTHRAHVHIHTTRHLLVLWPGLLASSRRSSPRPFYAQTSLRSLSFEGQSQDVWASIPICFLGGG